MKKIVIFCCCFLLFSCRVHKTTLSPFVAVYKSDWVGNVYPAYILLRTQPKIFEVYAPGIYESTFGEWNINNDTLFLFPKYEYFARKLGLKLHEITQEDTTVATIPQQYLMKNDSLIDITDYSIVLPELFYNPNNKEIYKRVNNR